MPSLSSTVARLERDHTGRKKKQRAEFLKHVDVMDFLERVEAANVSHATADEVLFSCPFPGHSHGDEKPSAYMNDGSKDSRLTTVWKCHGCGRSGNAITFLADHEHISRQEATNQLKQLYAPGFMAPKGGSMNAEFNARWKQYKQERKGETQKIKLLDWEMYHNRFGVDWTIANDPQFADEPEVHYMMRRGFSPGECEEWGIGYDDISDRLTIPICDPEGNLVGIKGRAWRDGVKPKYLILGDTEKTIRLRGRVYKFKPYDKSMIVFGIDKWGECARYVFVEGEIDVMSLWKMGIPALCTGGASMSEAQAKLIREYTDEIVLFLDNDTAGSNSIWGYENDEGEHKPGVVELLEPFIRVRIVGPHKFDANDYLRKGKQGRAKRLIDQAEMAYLLRP